MGNCVLLCDVGEYEGLWRMRATERERAREKVSVRECEREPRRKGNKKCMSEGRDGTMHEGKERRRKRK